MLGLPLRSAACRRPETGRRGIDALEGVRCPAFVARRCGVLPDQPVTGGPRIAAAFGNGNELFTRAKYADHLVSPSIRRGQGRPMPR